MRYKNVLSFVMIFIFLLTLAAGCGRSDHQVTAETKKITITDSMGRSVQVPCPPKRIVAATSDVAELICAFGSEYSIVGASDTCIKDPMLAQKLKNANDIGKAFTPNAEKITALKPDIVFGYGSFLEKDIINKLQREGIPVVLLDCYKLETMEQDIRTLGKILAKEKEAEAYIAVFNKYRSLVVERTKKLPASKKPLVYVEGYTDYSTNSAGSGGAQMLETAGGRNIAGDLSVPYPKVNPEWVLAKNPQVIIKAVASSVPSGYGKSPEALKKKRAEIISRPGWSKITAVKNGKVYIISNDIYTGPRAVVGIAYMAKWIHPDLFRDLDPAAIHKEILKKFHGLEPKGTWVYP